MSSLLFNAPYWLLAILGLIALVVLFTGFKRDHSNLRTAGVALGGVVVLLLLLRNFVETDEKRVETKTRQLVEAIAHQDWSTMDGLLKHAQLADFQGDDVAKAVKGYAQMYNLTDIRINSIDVKTGPMIITASLSVTSSHKDTVVDSVPSSWNLEYQKRSTGWVLTNIVPTRIGTWTGAEMDQFVRRGSP